MLIIVSMHIHIVPNRNSKPAVLLRESYRVGGSVRKRTLANLSKLPMDAVDAIKRILKGEKLVSLGDAFEIVENGSRLHGHVDAVLSAMRQLGFEKLVASRHSRERDLVVAMVAARILEPQSKLATSLWWHTTTLPEILGVSDANEDDLYAAMDWVLKRQVGGLPCWRDALDRRRRSFDIRTRARNSANSAWAIRPIQKLTGGCNKTNGQESAEDQMYVPPPPIATTSLISSA